MKTTHRRQRRAFTLIELLVVLVILGLLAALVGPRLLGNVERGRRGTATGQISHFKTALNLYSLDAGGPPSSQQGLSALLEEPSSTPRPLNWRGPYLDEQVVPLDPWGSEFVYESPGPLGEDFVIISYGKDGQEGGTDDDADIYSTDLGAG